MIIIGIGLMLVQHDVDGVSDVLEISRGVSRLRLVEQQHLKDGLFDARDAAGGLFPVLDLNSICSLDGAIAISCSIPCSF